MSIVNVKNTVVAINIPMIQIGSGAIKTPNTAKISTACLIFSGALTATPARAEEINAAKGDYEATCASCHGKTGKGDGPLVPDLKTPPPNLTLLAKNNDGVFPAEVLYRIIDGRKTIRAHGTYDMPVWGSLFQRTGSEESVKKRISGIIEYLKSIQLK